METKYKCGEKVVFKENLFLLNDQQKKVIKKYVEVHTKQEHKDIHSNEAHNKKLKLKLDEKQKLQIISIKNAMFEAITKIIDNTQNSVYDYLVEEELVEITEHAKKRIVERSERTSLDTENNPFSKLASLDIKSQKLEDVISQIITEAFIKSNQVEDKIEFPPPYNDENSFARITYTAEYSLYKVSAEIKYDNTNSSQDSELVIIVTVIKKD
ncbi:hypothetical protein [Macrococcus capreoli]|uniref:hypothetical protein n=1 Tax=Macrococcus capreoli TaxID=2982690 RepID=UPI0021D56EA2|nr:hypothetical protein [Macrococcus sp. TMW 2.2395]MCU7558612.1 hypothetical protein [Macrococcus sp. TMW 2.2395]